MEKTKRSRIKAFCAAMAFAVLVSSMMFFMVRAEKSEDAIAFTDEELAYIAQGKEVRLVNMTNRAPLSYKEDGELKGISVDIMKWIEENTGLHFTYLELPAGGNPIDYITQGNAEVAVGILNYGENLNNPDIIMTDTFFFSDAALAAKKGAVIDMSKPLKVLVNKGYRMGYQFLKDTYPNYNIEYAESTEAALKALQKGEADLVFQSIYVIDEYLKRPSYSDLKLYKSSITQEELACAVAADGDTILADIFNKAIAAMPEEYTRQLIVDYTITRMYYPTISEQIANNPSLFIETGVIIFGLIIMVILFVRLKSHRRLMRVMSGNEEYLKNITNNMNGGLVSITKKDGFRIVFANDRFWNVVNGEGSEPKTGSLFLDFLCDEDKNRVEAGFEKAWFYGEMLEMNVGINASSGKVPILLKGTRNSDSNGQQNITCVMIDFSREQALKEALEEEKEMYRMFMEDSKDIMFYCDIKTNECTWPLFYEERFGIVPPKFIYDGKEAEAFRAIIAEEDLALFVKAMEELKNHKKKSETRVRLKTADGTYRWYRVKLNSMEKDGKMYRMLGRMTDIDKEVNKMRRLSDANMRDKLTGLYNKDAFYRFVKKYMEEEGNSGALLFLDLDNFKNVNDQMGHLTGDEILINAANSMKQIFRSDDIISRFGGDEFMIFLKGVNRKVAAGKVQTMRAEIARIRKECDAEKTGLSACIGVSIYPSDADNVEQLVSKADAAMYHVKQNGKNGYAFYEDIKEE